MAPASTRRRNFSISALARATSGSSVCAARHTAHTKGKRAQNKRIHFIVVWTGYPFRLSMRKTILCALVVSAVAMLAQQASLFPTLRTKAGLGKQTEGIFLVPTNQMLHPWGEQTVIAGRPVDMAFDSEKRILAVLNWRGILLLDGSTGAKLEDVPSKSTSYTGIAFRPGNRELWASETTRNGPDSILVVKLSETGMPGETSRIELKGHPVPAGMAFAPDGRTAYVAFSRGNTLAAIDATTHEIIKQVDVGIAPFGVAVSKVQGRVFVSNRGGRRARANDTIAPSSGTQVVTDPITGSSTTGSISVVDVKTLEARDVPVGLAPSQLALSADEKQLAVANAHSDSVTILDAQSLTPTEVKIPTFPEAPLGSQPVALAFAPD